MEARTCGPLAEEELAVSVTPRPLPFGEAKAVLNRDQGNLVSRRMKSRLGVA